jgi:phosphoribosylaminoimidazole-succinocarboxamide synthase
MNNKNKIIESIDNVFDGLEMPELSGKLHGKVRDIFIQGDKRILVTTDRQSAFDVILGCVPYKGTVLNQLSQFWFETTKDIIPNHMIDVIDKNVMIAKECTALPVEIIVRGYISGVTNTSIWGSYEKGERNIYGIDFPDGLKKNQLLPFPVITPTTHGGGANGHDERLTKKQILDRGIIERNIYEQIEFAALRLFSKGTDIAAKAGLILVDTKYEFGIYNGEITLIDEIHTPDSSRFWKADSYQERFNNNLEPENYDKEFLRLWYANQGYKGEGVPPKMTQELIVSLAERYISVYEMLTGKSFELFDYPIEQRVTTAIKKYLSI